MKGFTLFIAVAPALAFANDNQAPGSTAILEVQETDNGDGSFSYWVSVTPNTPGIELMLIETTVMGNLHQSYLEDEDVIAMNDGSVNINLFSQQEEFGDLDPAYDPSHDTVFVDDVLLEVFEIELDPPGDGAPAGTSSQRVGASNLVNMYPIFFPGDELFPIWHVTTWGQNLRLTGAIFNDLFQDGEPFEWHVPEPSGLALFGLGSVGLLARRRRE